LSFEKLLDPTGKKRKEFDELVNDLASLPPKADYSKIGDVDFLAVGFLRRLLEIQASYMVLFRSFAAMYKQAISWRKMLRSAH
jgi:hypothetical protein